MAHVIASTIWGPLMAGGIIALMGAAFGAVLNRWLERSGRLYVNAEAVSQAFLAPDSYGSMSVSDDPGSAQGARFTCRLLFYNDAATARGLRSLQLQFCTDRKRLFAKSPETTEVTLTPRSWTTHSVNITLDAADAQRLVRCDRVVLRAEWPNGKVQRWPIATLSES